MSDFAATHVIDLESAHGRHRSVYVRIEEQPGPAYTRVEWDTISTADWEVQPDGTITFQGRAAPDGWFVDAFRPLAAAS